jgi:hypothetical protein
MMNAWLETWDRVQMPEGSHHSSSDGMMSEEQMQELDEANSAEGALPGRDDQAPPGRDQDGPG